MYMFLPLEMVERIIIIDNSSEENLFNIDTVLPHYGSLDACVTVIRRRDLTPIGTGGWHMQQLLKIEVSKMISTRRYVALDAKNHLCYPVPSDFFETPDETTYSVGVERPPRLPHWWTRAPLSPGAEPSSSN
jgi:hypothetical protein